MGKSSLESEYRKREPILKALGEYVKTKIIDSLKIRLGAEFNEDKLFQIPPTIRVKKLESLQAKCVRKKINNPFTDIEDQVAIRFVVLLLKELDIVGEVIEGEEWLCSKDRDHEKEKLENPGHFAYQSNHYVVRLKSSIDYHSVLIEKGIPCEIQVRTLLQHAYAQMSHAVDYKPSITLPDEAAKKVRRSLAKGSALIETTDDVFKQIDEHIREYDAGINELLRVSSKIYKEITEYDAPYITPLGQHVADQYREELKNLSEDQLNEWAQSKLHLKKSIIPEREESVFYRDAVVILVLWLVDNYQLIIHDKWPLEEKYLEKMFTMQGISTSGLF